VPVLAVSTLAIWGTRSATQSPDSANARIDGKPVPEVISDTDWLQGEFIATVQKRGAAIIEARGLSSAASAASAVIDTVRSLREPTPDGDWFSVAVASEGQYGTPEGLQFGFPVRADGKGAWSVVDGLSHDKFAAERVRITTEELEAERGDVRALDLIG